MTDLGVSRYCPRTRIRTRENVERALIRHPSSPSWRCRERQARASPSPRAPIWPRAPDGRLRQPLDTVGVRPGAPGRHALPVGDDHGGGPAEGRTSPAPGSAFAQPLWRRDPLWFRRERARGSDVTTRAARPLGAARRGRPTRSTGRGRTHWHNHLTRSDSATVAYLQRLVRLYGPCYFAGDRAISAQPDCINSPGGATWARSPASPANHAPA